MILLFSVTFKADAQPKPSKDSLNLKQQSLVAIAAQTAKGDLTALKVNLNAGLASGLTVNEIKEAIVHCYAYCGFPRSIRALQTFMVVVEDRKAKGIIDVLGAEASSIETKESKYDRGKIVLEKLTGTKETGSKKGYAAFAPIMEIFLKEHLFADIFERDVLTFQDRELLTVSVIASIGDAEPMLLSHLNICLNVGLTPAQLQQFVQIIEPIIGNQKTKAAQKVLKEVLTAKLKG
ncbi:carboxymuconolactone decarboxylase family protein [Pedobacter mucosus]|uniref:carboxymuconolactone decarboxylase family protein n=1 Tax=Pedobacter mucosus TaxID=2895286 RepID=UPI001EE3C035|nr:carboxymuconolactone decarboxylase family protein [Pedobacter mucosus]UKT64275.1 carboxymuconolactone decarboxylase family protein [Pedobacter mucosus]